jgi:hypothetical protein
MQFDEFTVVAIVQEDGEGRRSMDHAARIWNDGREAEQLGPLVHELDLDRDSRRLNKARLEAGELAIEVMPLVSSFLSLGTGYGTEPDWRHGAHQGPLVVQRRSYALSDPETVRAAYGLVDAMAEFTIGPHKGYGLFEYAVLGANARYQLEGKRR